MENRQLNLDAPLLSVRRFTSPTRSSELVNRNVIENPLPHRQKSLPLDKSYFETEEVAKPAAVPFQWEKIPGKSKGGVYTPEEPSITPKLPPAMVSDAIRRNSGEIPRVAPVRLSGPLKYNSGEIPRFPPGRVSSSSRYNSGERSSDQNIYRTQMEAYSFMDHASLLDKLNESLDCKDESDTGSEDECCDELYSLSRTESSSFNYSVSGLSGCHSSGVRPSGTFSVDVQTREFMMNRFLPAAKAVVVETPQYVGKKPSMVNEQPKEQIKKVISCEIKPSSKQYGYDSSPAHSVSMDNVESEDEEQERPVPMKKPGKFWGILPRFCVKNSLCRFNPLPGMKLRTHTPTLSAAEVRRPTQKAHSGPLYKSSSHLPHQKKFHSGLLSRDLKEIEKKLDGDSNQILNYLGSYKSGLYPMRRNGSGGIAPYRNESPKPQSREGTGFIGFAKGVEDDSAKKIASSRKMFMALQDVSRNQVNGASKPEYVVEGVKDIKMNELSHKKSNPPLESYVTSGKRDSYSTESDDQKEFGPACMKSPLPPPLPKSPSESWLWRTLPSVSLGSPFSHPRSKSPFDTKRQVQKVCKTDTKWETIVKSSNLRHDHARYSAELIPFGTYRQNKS